MTTPESVQSPVASPATPTGPARNPGLILAYLCIAGFMTFLDVSIVNVALPTIEDKLHISPTELPYVITTYGMLLGGFLLLCGRLADTFGRRRMLQTGLTLFALSSLVAGVSQNVVMLIASRGAQGLGAAFIATSALSLLTNNFEEGAARNKALGVWGALSGLAAVVGVTLGGVLTDGPGWRWIFFINVPIGIIGALIAPMIVGESRAPQRSSSFDIAGAISLTAGLVILIFTLGQTVSDQHVPVVRITIGFILTVVLLAAFVVIEQRAKSPLIPLGIFRRASLRGANLTALLLLGNVATLFFFASLFMQQVLDYSPLRTGLSYVPLAIVTAVGAGIASNVTTKAGPKPTLIIGLLLATGGMLLMYRAPETASYPVDLLPAYLITGLGLGMSFVPLQIVAFTGTVEHEAGLAAGLINTSQEVGGALGLAVVATIAFRDLPELTARAHGVPALVRATRTDVFHQAFLVGAGMTTAALLIALFLLPVPKGAGQQAPAQAH
jgi:EmrB/QacA subfamily drug resistance transporter